jgi:hypothetical protein
MVVGMTMSPVVLSMSLPILKYLIAHPKQRGRAGQFNINGICVIFLAFNRTWSLKSGANGGGLL